MFTVCGNVAELSARHGAANEPVSSTQPAYVPCMLSNGRAKCWSCRWTRVAGSSPGSCPCALVTAFIRALGCLCICLLWPLRQRNSRCPARWTTPGTHITYWNDKLGRCDAISSVLCVAVLVLIPSSPASPPAHPAAPPSASEGVTNDHGCALPARLLANTQALSSQHSCARLGDCPFAHAGHSAGATHAASLIEAPREHI